MITSNSWNSLFKWPPTGAIAAVVQEQILIEWNVKSPLITLDVHYTVYFSSLAKTTILPLANIFLA